ncbi:MAG: LacI family DNA-binding transcriptional regulator [Chthoniobacterales bacterium]
MSSTQKGIAKLAGVSQSTVSLALAGSKEVSTAQRALIHKIAAQLRYRPSVDAQRLASRKAGVVNRGAVLAWINQEITQDFWQRHPISRAYWDGAQKQASLLGYKLDAFWMHESGMTQKRLSTILQNRGIEGVVFPHYATSSVKMEWNVWKKFAVVSLNHPFTPAVADHVCADFQYNTDLCMEQLLKNGPQSIGLVLKDVFNKETSATCLARYLFHTSTLPKNLQIPPLITPDILSEKQKYLIPWIRKWKPKILLARDYEVTQALANSGLSRVPDIVQLQLNEMTKKSSGIDEKNKETGSAAIELLCGKLHQGKFGIMRPARVLLIKGSWKTSSD